MFSFFFLFLWFCSLTIEYHEAINSNTYNQNYVLWWENCLVRPVFYIKLIFYFRLIFENNFLGTPSSRGAPRWYSSQSVARFSSGRTALSVQQQVKTSARTAGKLLRVPSTGNRSLCFFFFFVFCFFQVPGRERFRLRLPPAVSNLHDDNLLVSAPFSRRGQIRD